MNIFKALRDRLPVAHGVGCGAIYCLHTTQHAADVCSSKRHAMIYAVFETAGYDLTTNEFCGGPALTLEERERRRDFRELYHLPPSKRDDTAMKH